MSSLLGINMEVHMQRPSPRSLALLLGVLCLGEAACVIRVVEGSGVEATDLRLPAPFNAVENGSLLDVELVVGDAHEVQITCDDNLLEYLKTEVREASLKLYQPTVVDEPNTFLELHPSGRCLAKVTAPSLVRIDSAGSGGVHGEADWSALERVHSSGSGGVELTGRLPQLEELESSGSGAVRITGVTGALLRVEVSGAGDVSLGGEVAVLELNSSGAGKTLARGLPTERANVRVSGSGGAEILATGCVDITITGSGDVRVAGGPRICNIDTPGSGEVLFD